MLRRVLISLESFLALTAIGGGIGLITGTVAPPVEMLAHSPFSGYLIPGLALLFVVGGVAATAAVLLLRKHARALLVCGVSAVAIVVFEVIEILAIGSPEGVARNLQILYLVVGILIGALALTAKMKQVRARNKE